MTLSKDSITALRQVVRGAVVAPEDAAYDKLRATSFNKTARPAIVVMCTSTEDVTAALAYARKHKLVISIRSGGHNGAGLSTNNEGIVIDVTNMNDVEVIDADRRLVRVGAGAKWGDVATALAPHGLALTSGDTRSVGVSGLTLGGGLGWMVRKYGLTIDSLISVDMVTVDGKLLHLSKKENAELFWAVRGAGANFGVAVAFEFVAQPITHIFGGTITYDFTDRKAVLQGWAAYMRTAPRELTTIVNMMGNFMPGVPETIMMTVCYASNNKAAADAAIAPLLNLGKVLSNDIKEEPYGDILADGMEMGELKVIAHNGFVPKLNDELIDLIVTTFAKKEAPIIQIRSLGGAVDDVAKDEMAFCHRGNEAFIVAPAFYGPDTPRAEAQKASDATWAPLKPFLDGAYCNFFTDTRISTIIESFPADVYERLTKIKAMYDPANLLNQNANIEPSLPKAIKR